MSPWTNRLQRNTRKRAPFSGSLFQVVWAFSSGTPINPAARQVGGPGMGIAQWSRGARWTSLVKYARATGRSPYALDTQLDCIWRELNGTEKRALRKLRSSRALPAATVAFATHYERCAPRWCHNAKRTQNARKVLASYGR